MDWPIQIKCAQISEQGHFINLAIIYKDGTEVERIRILLKKYLQKQKKFL